MKPNTPTKITMISHITYWCRWSMSRASCEPGDWKYHARACALVAAASAARPANAERSLDPLMFFFPDLDAQSLFQLAGEAHARFFVEVPSYLHHLSRCAQPDVRALHLDLRTARLELVARDALGFGDFHAPPSIGELDALVIGRVARLQHERDAERKDFEPGERQDQPRARHRKADSDPQHRNRKRCEHACECCRCNRAIPLEDQAEVAALAPQRQLEARRTHRAA